MGRWRVAGDGSDSGALARHPERDFAKWLCGWVFAGGIGLSLRVSRVGLAGDVLAGRIAGAAGVVHQHEGAGIGSVGEASRVIRVADAAGGRRAMETPGLSRVLDDV